MRDMPNPNAWSTATLRIPPHCLCHALTLSNLPSRVFQTRDAGMSRLSLRTKAEAPPEPVTDAHCEAAFHAVQASEEPLAVTMAGLSPGGEVAAPGVGHAAPSPGPALVTKEEGDPSQDSGRAKRSVRRKSAVIIDAASDEEEAGVEDKPGERVEGLCQRGWLGTWVTMRGPGCSSRRIPILPDAR